MVPHDTDSADRPRPQGPVRITTTGLEPIYTHMALAESLDPQLAPAVERVTAALGPDLA